MWTSSVLVCTICVLFFQSLVEADLAGLMQCAFTDGDSHCKARLDGMVHRAESFATDSSWLEPEAKVISEEFSEFGSMCYFEPNGTKGCMPHLHESSQQFYQQLLANTGTDPTCSSSSQAGAAAASAVGVVDMLSDFWCITSEHEVPCPLAVSSALHQAGLDQKLFEMLQTRGTPKNFDVTSMNIPAICSALETAGCCSQSFFQMVNMLLKLACVSNPAISTVIVMLPHLCQLPTVIHGNGRALPHACPGFSTDDYQQFVPHQCPQTSWAEDMADLCDDSQMTQACPTNMCELGCAVVRNFDEEVRVRDFMDAEPKGPTVRGAHAGEEDANDNVQVILAVIGASVGAVVLIALAAIGVVKYKQSLQKFVEFPKFDATTQGFETLDEGEL